MAKDALTDADYKVLADFRTTLRRFLAFSEAAATEIGLTAQQHQTLLAIKATQPDKATIGSVAEWLMLKPHSVTGLIDRLEALGLVERRAASDDRRQTHVVLTGKADAMLATLTATHRDEVRRLRPMLVELLGRISD